MSIAEKKVIDSINTTPDSSELILSMTDHFPWDSSLDVKEHIYMLQEKIKSYIDFVESGELENKFPNYNGMPVAINIIAKHGLPDDELVKQFYEYAQRLVSDAGLKFQFSVFRD